MVTQTKRILAGHRQAQARPVLEFINGDFESVRQKQVVELIELLQRIELRSIQIAETHTESELWDLLFDTDSVDQKLEQLTTQVRRRLAVYS